MDSTRTCTKCGEAKLRERARVKRYYEANAEKCREKERARRKRLGKAAIKEINKIQRSRQCRFKIALVASKHTAKRRSYVSCTASVEEIKAAFTGYCGICGKREEKAKLHMDHDHKTGAFRFWLCEHCNKGLGCFRDSPALLRTAAERLEGGS